MTFGNKEKILYGNRFNGTKGNGYQPIKKEQTNEDCLRSCDTEQLAEKLFAWWFDGANTYAQFGLFKWEIDEAKERIMVWLKQPHKPNS